MTEKPNGFDMWFSQVKEIHASRGGAGLVEMEDWLDDCREGLSPEDSLNKYVVKHKE